MGVVDEQVIVLRFEGLPKFLSDAATADQAVARQRASLASLGATGREAADAMRQAVRSVAPDLADLAAWEAKATAGARALGAASASAAGTSQAALAQLPADLAAVAAWEARAAEAAKERGAAETAASAASVAATGREAQSLTALAAAQKARAPLALVPPTTVPQARDALTRLAAGKGTVVTAEVDVSAAQRLLGRLAAGRTAPVEARADVTQARDALTRLAAGRQTPIDVLARVTEAREAIGQTAAHRFATVEVRADVTQAQRNLARLSAQPITVDPARPINVPSMALPAQPRASLTGGVVPDLGNVAAWERRAALAAKERGAASLEASTAAARSLGPIPPALADVAAWEARTARVAAERGAAQSAAGRLGAGSAGPVAAELASLSLAEVGAARAANARGAAEAQAGANGQAALRGIPLLQATIAGWWQRLTGHAAAHGTTAAATGDKSSAALRREAQGLADADRGIQHYTTSALRAARADEVLAEAAARASRAQARSGGFGGLTGGFGNRPAPFTRSVGPAGPSIVQAGESAWQSLAAGAQAAGGVASRALSGIGTAGTALAGGLFYVGGAVVGIGVNIAVSLGGLALRTLESLGRAALTTAAHMGRIGLVAVGVGAAAAGAFAHAAVSEARARDIGLRGLTAVMGGADAATAHLAQLKEVALLPGINLSAATKMSVQLQAVGVSADMTLRSLKAFANLNAIIGGGADVMERVGMSISEMAGRGKVGGEQLRELARNLPPLMGLIRTAFGTTNSEEIDKMGFTFDTFMAKLLPVAEAYPRAAGGILNASVNLKMGWQELLIAFGKPLIGENSIALLDTLAGALVKLAPLAGDLGARFAAGLPGITDWLKGALSTENLTAFGQRVEQAFTAAVALAQRTGQSVAQVVQFVRDHLSGALSKGGQSFGKVLGDALSPKGLEAGARFIVGWGTTAEYWFKRTLLRLEELRLRAPAALAPLGIAALDLGRILANVAEFGAQALSFIPGSGVGVKELLTIKQQHRDFAGWAKEQIGALRGLTVDQGALKGNASAVSELDSWYKSALADADKFTLGLDRQAQAVDKVTAAMQRLADGPSGPQSAGGAYAKAGMDALLNEVGVTREALARMGTGSNGATPWGQGVDTSQLHRIEEEIRLRGVAAVKLDPTIMGPLLNIAQRISDERASAERLPLVEASQLAARRRQQEAGWEREGRDEAERTRREAAQQFARATALDAAAAKETGAAAKALTDQANAIRQRYSQQQQFDTRGLGQSLIKQIRDAEIALKSAKDVEAAGKASGKSSPQMEAEVKRLEGLLSTLNDKHTAMLRGYTGAEGGLKNLADGAHTAAEASRELAKAQQEQVKKFGDYFAKSPQERFSAAAKLMAEVTQLQANRPNAAGLALVGAGAGAGAPNLAAAQPAAAPVALAGLPTIVSALQALDAKLARGEVSIEDPKVRAERAYLFSQQQDLRRQAAAWQASQLPQALQPPQAPPVQPARVDGTLALRGVDEGLADRLKQLGEMGIKQLQPGVWQGATAQSLADIERVMKAQAAKQAPTPERVYIEMHQAERERRQQTGLNDALTSQIIGNLGAGDSAILAQARLLSQGEQIRAAVTGAAHDTGQIMVDAIKQFPAIVRKQVAAELYAHIGSAT